MVVASNRSHQFLTAYTRTERGRHSSAHDEMRMARSQFAMRAVQIFKYVSVDRDLAWQFVSLTASLALGFLDETSTHHLGAITAMSS